jgi:hypothetical protein
MPTNSPLSENRRRPDQRSIWRKRGLLPAALSLLLGAVAGSGCHSSDSGSELTGPDAGGSSAGIGGGLVVGEPDAAQAGQAGASSSAPGECTELSGLGDCGTTTLRAEHDIANILLVLDKSGSMVDQPDGFSLNKWDALKTALDAALHKVEGEINFGLVLYPFAADHAIPADCGNECCSLPSGSLAVNVPIEPGAGVSKVLDAVNAAEPSGGTPTAAALASALNYFTVGAGAAIQGQKYVLLATDGGPNCNADNTCDAAHCTQNLDGQCASGNCCAKSAQNCLDDVNVVTQIKGLADAGVSTFVVGIPGTEKYAEFLDTFAINGGVPNPDAPPSYYAVSAKGGVQGLVDVFTGITTHLVRDCDVALENTPKNLDLINVAVDCQVIPYADGAGWSITGDDQKTLVIAGKVCQTIQTNGAERVDVVYGCPTVR